MKKQSIIQKHISSLNYKDNSKYLIAAFFISLLICPTKLYALTNNENTLGSYINEHKDTIFIVVVSVLLIVAVMAVLLAYIARKNRQKIIEANEAKMNFLFNMSHDIRTPMNAIIGFTNMALKKADDKEAVTEYMHKIQISSELMLSLINSILDMSRIESGKISVNESKSDVMMSFVNVEDTMKELAKQKNIDLSFSLDNIKDRYVYCDISLCMRVFVNIISNAIKYTNEGGTVKVKGEQIGKKGNIGIYKYTFEDNGIGMSEAFQKHAFDMFARENSSTTSGIQGTGLGLSLCKAFVEAMNGKIEFTSKKGKGTSFYVTLPLRIQEGQDYIDPTNGEVVTAIDKQDEIDLKGKKVLVAEDNELNLEIVVDMLKEEGMIVETAEDGDVAIKLMKEKGPDYYDLILMDIQMPKVDGYQATKEIRKMYPDKNIPIIAVSANAFAEDKAASLAAGMNEHVAKPININELKTSMAKFLK